jgi:hypothetical protein
VGAQATKDLPLPFESVQLVGPGGGMEAGRAANLVRVLGGAVTLKLSSSAVPDAANDAAVTIGPPFRLELLLLGKSIPLQVCHPAAADVSSRCECFDIPTICPCGAVSCVEELHAVRTHGTELVASCARTSDSGGMRTALALGPPAAATAVPALAKGGLHGAERGDDGVGDHGHLGESAERVLAALPGNGRHGRLARVQGDQRGPCGGG